MSTAGGPPTPREAERTFTPAAGFHLLTRFYDRAMSLTREDEMRERMQRALRLEPGMRILDVGCGTGSFAVRLARELPGVQVVGLDPDTQALAIAARKARDAGVAVDWQRGFADAPPLRDAAFDRVTSTLLLHHLPSDAKRASLAAMRRLLAPDGFLLLADWDRPDGLRARIGFAAVRLLDGFDTTQDNREGLLPERMREAGFARIEPVDRLQTIYGTLALWRAR